MKAAAIAWLVVLAGCAGARPGNCRAVDEVAARALAGAAAGADGGSLAVEDLGDRWRLGRTAETWLEGDMIMSRDAGFTLTIHKCSGAVSDFRSWP